MVIQTAVLLLTLVAPVPATPERYVTDAANVLDDTREQALNERLAQLHREETAQILVYVDRKLPANTTIGQFGAEALRKWAPGTAKKDNGAILLLFIDDRESRIEVGYGLEEKLTDAKAKRILVLMRGPLRAGDYDGAVEQGAAMMTDVALGRGLPAPPVRPSSPTPAAAPTATNLEVVLLLLSAAAFAVAVVLWLIKIIRDNGPWTSAPRPRDGRPGLTLSDDDRPAESTDSDSSSSDSGWSWSTSDDASSSSSSWSSSSSSSSDSSSSSSSSSSSYSSGGGSGGGGGASDKW
ncbi:MAG TPA: TPM domain-containing protein [Thermoanaerobaculia bacterium]|jgi:uncharacterized protein